MMTRPIRTALQGVAIVLIAGAIAWLMVGANAGTQRVRKGLGKNFEYDLERYGQSDAPRLARELAPIPLSLAVPTGLAVGPDGLLYVTGDRAIVMLDRAGAVVRQVALERAPGCIAVAPDGTLFVGHGDHVAVYAPDGARLAAWPSLGPQALVTDIAIGDEDVYIADAGGRVVHRCARDGGVINRIGDRDPARDIKGFVIPSPYFALGIAPGNKLWVVDPGRHEFQHYTPDGALLATWRKIGMTIEGFCGCCNPTHIAFRTDSSVVTSEKGFVRVKIYTEAGDLKGIVAGPEDFDEGTRGLDLAVDGDGRILVLDPSRRQVRVFTETHEQGAEL